MKPIKIVPGSWSWDRPCPWCGAGINRRCIDPHGKPAPTHSDRMNRLTARPGR